MSFINATPHEINLYDGEGQVIIRTYPSSGSIRCLPKDQSVLEITFENIQILSPPEYDRLDGDMRLLSLEEALDPKGGIIVSMEVARFLVQNPPEQKINVYSPNTGPTGAVRRQDGMIIGCKGLIRWMGH